MLKLSLKPKYLKRISWAAVVAVGLGIVVTLVFTALEKNMMFFYKPSELLASEASKRFGHVRLGGFVTKGSIDRTNAPNYSFHVTDTKATLTVQFSGILPDLFREGQGIVAEGRLRKDGIFEAKSLLAKHDENYRPPGMENLPIASEKQEKIQLRK